MKKAVTIPVIFVLFLNSLQYVKGDNDTEQKVNYNHSFVFLILGVDERPGDTGRSDAIFLVTVNPYKKSIMLTNIPRDTYVSIPRKKKDKVNHSYAFGGETLIKQTIEGFLKLSIDGYAKVNMQSLEFIVDRIGGIDVEVPFNFTFHAQSFRKGKMHLNGQQALHFVRMRKEDPTGDLGRNNRQFEVIKAVIKKATQPYVMLRIIPIVQEVMKSVKTDISPITILQLAYIYYDVKMDHIATNQLKGNGVRMDGIYYYIVEKEEVTRFRKIINKYKENGLAS